MSPTLKMVDYANAEDNDSSVVGLKESHKYDCIGVGVGEGKAKKQVTIPQCTPYYVTCVERSNMSMGNTMENAAILHKSSSTDKVSTEKGDATRHLSSRVKDDRKTKEIEDGVEKALRKVDATDEGMKKSAIRSEKGERNECLSSLEKYENERNGVRRNTTLADEYDVKEARDTSKESNYSNLPTTSSSSPSLEETPSFDCDLFQSPELMLQEKHAPTPQISTIEKLSSTEETDSTRDGLPPPSEVLYPKERSYQDNIQTSREVPGDDFGNDSGRKDFSDSPVLLDDNDLEGSIGSMHNESFADDLSTGLSDHIDTSIAFFDEKDLLVTESDNTSVGTKKPCDLPSASKCLESEGNNLSSEKELSTTWDSSHTPALEALEDDCPSKTKEVNNTSNFNDFLVSSETREETGLSSSIIPRHGTKQGTRLPCVTNGNISPQKQVNGIGNRQHTKATTIKTSEKDWRSSNHDLSLCDGESRLMINEDDDQDNLVTKNDVPKKGTKRKGQTPVEGPTCKVNPNHRKENNSTGETDGC